MSKFPKRGDIFWVDLNPTVGSEINKIRPALIVSNNFGNEFSNRVIVAPITSSIKYLYPFEVKITLEEVQGKILLDQIRTIDKKRIAKKLTTADKSIMDDVDAALKLVLFLS